MHTLSEVVYSHVLPGSIVVTDGWSGYNELRIWFDHLIVNHSENFVDPESGAITTTIERTWNGIKHQIAPRNRQIKIRERLSLFIWRRLHKKTLWNSFLDAIKSN